MSNIDNVNTSCGTIEISTSILLVFFGTVNSISHKAMMDMTCTDDDNGTPKVVPFDKPLFVTFVMFLAYASALVLHWAVMIFKLDFPGYDFGNSKKEGYDTQKRIHKTMQMYFIPFIPAIFDTVSIALWTIGLQYLDLSIYQTLRSSTIIFVALLKHFVWRHRLLKFHWVSVFWNVVSVALVGVAAVLVSVRGEGGRVDVSARETVLGVSLVVLGNIAQALTAVTEEHLLKMDNPIPPLLVIGMHGT